MPSGISRISLKTISRLETGRTEWKICERAAGLMNKELDIDWGAIEKIIALYGGQREALLMIMQDISDIYHYMPPEVIPVLTDKLGVDEGLIYSVATFYKTISLEPRGKYIVNLCTGTACHVRGADKIRDVLKDKLNIECIYLE